MRVSNGRGGSNVRYDPRIITSGTWSLKPDNNVTDVALKSEIGSAPE